MHSLWSLILMKNRYKLVRKKFIYNVHLNLRLLPHLSLLTLRIKGVLKPRIFHNGNSLFLEFHGYVILIDFGVYLRDTWLQITMGTSHSIPKYLDDNSSN